MMQLEHISAVCRSYSNARRFYSEMLGMKNVKDFSIDQALTKAIFGVSCSCRIVCFQNESCMVEVFLPSEHVDGKNPFMHHCIKVDNCEAFLARCQQEKLRINRVPKGERFLVFVEDFDGNLYEIKDGDEA